MVDRELTSAARDLTARTRVAGVIFFLFDRDAGLRGVFDVYRAAQQKLGCLREGLPNSEQLTS